VQSDPRTDYFVVVGRSWAEKLTFALLVLCALQQKQDVAAKYDNGTFELVATGHKKRRLD
jgi:hypothetical protein